MANRYKKIMILLIAVFAVLFRHVDCQTNYTGLPNTLITPPTTVGLTSPLPPSTRYTGPDMPGSNSSAATPAGPLGWANSSATTPMGGANGTLLNYTTTQFPPGSSNTTNQQSSCTYSWYIYSNTNVNGGVPSRTTSVGSCQSECISNPDCTGVDWNDALPVNGQCFLIMWWNTQRHEQVAYGINHYDLVRSCPGSNNNNNNGNNNNNNNNNYKNGSLHHFPDVASIVALLLIAITANVSKHCRQTNGFFA